MHCLHLFAHSSESLQPMLNYLDQYCRTWGLTVNMNKTKVMVFERGRGTNCNIILNNTQLEVFQVFRYTSLSKWILVQITDSYC